MPGRISAAISARTLSSRMRAAMLMASQSWDGDRRAARGGQRRVVAALDRARDAIDVERADDGGDRQEQPQREQRGADAAEQVGGPAEPAVQVEQAMHRPDGGDVQRDEARADPEQAAEEHPQEDAVVELAKGAGEGGKQGDHLTASG